MKRVGLIGWRGMVGSVLMQRMREENDFADIEPIFFTTSQAGKPAPDVGKEGVPALQDAFDSAERIPGFRGLQRKLKAKPKALVVLYKREVFGAFKSAMGLATPQVRGIYKGVVVLFLGPGVTMVLVADQR